MKKLLEKSFLFLTFLLFLTSCSDKENYNCLEISQYPSLGLENHKTDQLSGNTTFDNHQLTYEVKDNKGDYYIKLVLDEHTLEAWVNFSSESLIHDGYGAVLTEEQKNILLDFTNQFGEAIVTNNENTPTNFEIGRMEFTFLRTLEFWSQAPKGFVHNNKTAIAHVATKSINNDGITCIRRNNNYTLQYTDRNNNVITKRRKAGYNGGGSYDCMGRCGASCGSWWVASAWTRDCFEHDQCSLDYNASGGGSDPNCGDEYWHAADDYVFGVIRGCRG